MEQKCTEMRHTSGGVLESRNLKSMPLRVGHSTHGWTDPPCSPLVLIYTWTTYFSFTFLTLGLSWASWLAKGHRSARSLEAWLTSLFCTANHAVTYTYTRCKTLAVHYETESRYFSSTTAATFHKWSYYGVYIWRNPARLDQRVVHVGVYKYWWTSQR